MKYSLEVESDTNSSVAKSSHYFHLDENTGELRQIRALDRELIPSLDVTVTARDQSPTHTRRLNSTYKLRVRVGDTNDNAPRFTQPRVQLAVRISRLGEEKFVKLASETIGIVDQDSFAINSANFLNVNLNRARESLFENAAALHSNVKFDDLTCFKSFNIDLEPVDNSTRLPVVVLVENEPDSSLDYVSCRLSFWIDTSALRRELAADANRTRLDMVVRANDYGLVYGSTANSLVYSRLDVQFDLISGAESDQEERTPRLVEFDLKEGVEFSVDLVDTRRLELISVLKLAPNDIDSKIKSIDYTYVYSLF